MHIPPRPRFRDGKEWVAIRHYKMAQDHDMNFGDKVDVPSRRILFSLYKRNIIGQVGELWTEMKMRQFCHRYGLNYDDYAPKQPKPEVKKEVIKQTEKKEVKKEEKKEAKKPFSFLKRKKEGDE